MQEQEGTEAASPGSFTRNGPAALSRSQLRTSTVAALALVAAGVFTLKGFLPALAWAVIFAIAIWPWHQRLQRRWPGHPELLASLFVLGVLVVFVVPLVLVTVPLVSDAHAAMRWVARARETGVAPPPALAGLPLG